MKNIAQKEVVILDSIKYENDLIIDVFKEQIKHDLLSGNILIEDDNLILKLNSYTYKIYLDELKYNLDSHVNYNQNFYKNLVIQSKQYFNMEFNKLIFRFKNNNQ